MTFITAHDVRRLKICKCGQPTLEREMIDTGTAKMCGRCAYKKLGTKGLLMLPKPELGKVRLDQVGPIVMKKLIG